MGVMPNVNGIGTTPVLVWSPGSARETQQITNIGQTTLYLGGSGVDSGNGLPFPPDSTVVLVGNGGQIYAVSAPGAAAAGGGSTTIATNPISSGATSMAVAANTNFATGDTVRIGSNAADYEVRVVTVSGTTFTWTGGLLYDHVVGDAVVEVVVPVTGAISLAVGAQ